MTRSRQRSGVVIVAVVWLVVGCEPQPQPKDDEPEPQPEIVVVEAPKPAEDDRDAKPVSPVDFFGSWPGEVEYDSFDLMWLGGDDEIELREEPQEDAEVVGVAGWRDGEEFHWRETMVRIDTPRAYESLEDFELEATPYDEEFGQLEAEDIVVDVEAGQKLFAYRYAGEYGCYLGVEQQVVYADCPADQVGVDPEKFDGIDAGEKWTGEHRQWWVMVDGEDGEGWFRADDAPLEVHPRVVEGYDDGLQPPF